MYYFLFHENNIYSKFFLLFLKYTLLLFLKKLTHSLFKKVSLKLGAWREFIRRNLKIHFFSFLSLKPCSLTEVIIESSDIYRKATSTYLCGYLLSYATTVRVPINIVNNYTNYYLNGSTWTRDLSDDGLYYVYTK